MVAAAKQSTPKRTLKKATQNKEYRPSPVLQKYCIKQGKKSSEENTESQDRPTQNQGKKSTPKATQASYRLSSTAEVLHQHTTAGKSHLLGPESRKKNVFF